MYRDTSSVDCAPRELTHACNSEFTLDYVCANDSAFKCVESAYILERGEVVESDNGAAGVNVEWKVRRKGKCRMKGKSKRKRRLTARNWESNGRKRL